MRAELAGAGRGRPAASSARCSSTADVGITGANFGVAETGSICLVTNEGNAGLVTSLPRIHIALIGMERLVSDARRPRRAAPAARAQRHGSAADDVHARSLTGPRGEGEQDGPGGAARRHRRQRPLEPASARRYREMLACIRCGACLNVCPVYRKTGGGRVRAGVLGADGRRARCRSLVGLERAPALPHASSLCGACTAACPVKIPLHELLLDLRRDLVDEGIAPAWERLAFTAVVVGLVVAVRLSRVDGARPARAAAGRTLRTGSSLGVRAGAAPPRRPPIRDRRLRASNTLLLAS